MADIELVLEQFSQYGPVDDLRKNKSLLLKLSKIDWEDRVTIYSRARQLAFDSEDLDMIDAVAEVIDLPMKQKKKQPREEEGGYDVESGDSEDEGMESEGDEGEERRPKRPPVRRTKKVGPEMDPSAVEYEGIIDPKTVKRLELQMKKQAELGAKGAAQKQKFEELRKKYGPERAKRMLAGQGVKETRGKQIRPDWVPKPSVSTDLRSQFEITLPRVVPFSTTALKAKPLRLMSLKDPQSGTIEQLFSLNAVPNEFRQFMRGLLFQYVYPLVGQHKLSGNETLGQLYSGVLLTGLIPYDESVYRIVNRTNVGQVHVITWKYGGSTFRREFGQKEHALRFKSPDNSYLHQSFLQWARQQKNLPSTVEEQKRQFQQSVGPVVASAYQAAVQRFNHATRLERLSISKKPEEALDADLVAEAMDRLSMEEKMSIDQLRERNKERYMKLLENQAMTLLKERHLSLELMSTREYQPEDVESGAERKASSLMTLVMEQILLLEEAAHQRTLASGSDEVMDHYLSLIGKPLVYLMEGYSDVAELTHFFKTQLGQGLFQIGDALSWTRADYFPEFFLSASHEEGLIEKGQAALDRLEMELRREIGRLYLSLIHPTKTLYTMRIKGQFPWRSYVDANVPGQCLALDSGYLMINGQKVPSDMNQIVIAQLDNGQFRCYNIHQVRDAIYQARVDKKFPEQVPDPYQSGAYLPVDFVRRVQQELTL